MALSKEQASIRSEAISVQHGVIGWDKVIDVCDVLAGKAKGRSDDKQIILYKNQGGQGIADLALAKKCYDLANNTAKATSFGSKRVRTGGCQGEGRKPGEVRQQLRVSREKGGLDD